MALKLKVTLSSGIVVNDAYARIFFLNWDKQRLNIGIEYFVDKASADSGKPNFNTFFYEFPPSVAEGSLNFVKQGYEYLKTLPEFVDTIDVLE